jgi:hypothetical protein
MFWMTTLRSLGVTCVLCACCCVLQGLTEWQLNSYYAAGRVMVPALLDVFTCQGFFRRQALLDLLTELAGKHERFDGHACVRLWTLAGPQIFQSVVQKALQ